MNDRDFKKKFKFAACTKRPWADLVPYKDRFKILRQVKQECLDIYGYDFHECNKRKFCFTKECKGRPLEWKSPTARPYLEKFAEINNIPIEGEYFVKDCNSCPIKQNCASTCNQVDDYINRQKVKEPDINHNVDIDRFSENAEQESIRPAIFKDLEIPWDILTDKRKYIIKKYLYEKRDFKYIADQLNINHQKVIKYHFYSALNKLSEYGVMRKFLKENAHSLNENQFNILNEIYFNNHNLKETAEKLNVSTQTIHKTVKLVVSKHNIQWKKFVTKKNGKIVYTIDTGVLYG